MANVPEPSVPPDPSVQESSCLLSELVVEVDRTPVVASDSSEDSLANVPEPSVPPDPGVQESSSSSPEFVPPLPPRDRPSRRSFSVSGAALDSLHSRSRNRSGRQSESPSPTSSKHRMPHVASVIPVRRKK